MALRSLNPCFPLSRRTGAIAVSGILIIFGFVFMVLCLSQLSASSSPPLMGSTQAAFAIASILQVLLVALGSTIIFISWKESSRLIRFCAYASVAHFALNLIVLALLLSKLPPVEPCKPGLPVCPKPIVASKSTWIGLSIFILITQSYLSLIVFSYSFHLQDYSRRPYIPEVTSRSLSVPTSIKLDQKHLLSRSETWPNVELGAVESAATTRSFKMLESSDGYGGGMRTYEEAEQNEKARLRREQEIEDEETQMMTFRAPSTSESGILTPLGLQWRDGDLPPYAS